MREGRTDTCLIQPDTPLRHPAEASLSVSALLALLAGHDARRGSRQQRP
ncbi:hypothetical protein ACFSL4_18025 [Streptomyces caeni]|uniref:Uncharacterized protein n=1 Tax=Streptomyces caeni TaxID=2307231 RepID=A0ABW4IVQ5_9ACTN